MVSCAQTSVGAIYDFLPAPPVYKLFFRQLFFQKRLWGAAILKTMKTARDTMSRALALWRGTGPAGGPPRKGFQMAMLFGAGWCAQHQRISEHAARLRRSREKFRREFRELARMGKGRRRWIGFSPSSLIRPAGTLTRSRPFARPCGLSAPPNSFRRFPIGSSLRYPWAKGLRRGGSRGHSPQRWLCSIRLAGGWSGIGR
jgi:hypothetical protein